MQKYYLAVDIGASSGRHMLGYISNDKMELKEVYRFANDFVNQDGHMCWDVKKLFKEIINGIKKCKELGMIPSYMGIDTWGVDYVLLDENDNILGNSYAYRDSRTYGMDEKVYETISKEELYEHTGIQKQIFNTIYQLMAVKEQTPQDMERAKSMLMIPDYFHFLLTGVKKMEYTNATTGQLVNAKTNDWDYELIEKLGYKKDLFIPLSMAGEIVGDFTQEIQNEVGFNCKVILPATHDTASAVLAVPADSDNVVYISSGTWSLMGTELKEANCSTESMSANFANEGGYEHRFRYLKNIMGLWMIQSVKKEFTHDISFAELCEKASQENIQSVVDCNDEIFLAPESMIQAVKEYCLRNGQDIPDSEGEIAAVIYNSLAKCYGETIKLMEKILGQSYDTIHVVGGGSNAEYLNELTAKYTKKEVLAGPSEATAIGNLMVQMLANGEFKNLKEARNIVKQSFEIKRYTI